MTRFLVDAMIAVVLSGFGTMLIPVPNTTRTQMSLAKRPASPTISVDKKARHDDDDPLDDYHGKNVAEWEAVQTCYSEAMSLTFSGMITEVDAATSFRAHRKSLEDQGYKFGTYNTDRSLFEKMDRIVLQDTPDALMGREVFRQARSILRQINEGSKPQRNAFSMLVMMNTEYVTPTADLLHLLTHPKATAEDLDLFWELTDRLWCFAHPIFRLHSGYLDETCRKITRRLAEVRQTST